MPLSKRARLILAEQTTHLRDMATHVRSIAWTCEKFNHPSCDPVKLGRDIHSHLDHLEQFLFQYEEVNEPPKSPMMSEPEIEEYLKSQPSIREGEHESPPDTTHADMTEPTSQR